jgi:superfamily I DNA/RNA helicase
MTNEVRVYGPPGTGKSTYLTRLIKEAAEKRGSDEIMVASFTKAAAAELVGRNLPISRQQVGTLHAHCYRQMGRTPIAETLLDEWNRDHPNLQLDAGYKGNIDDAVEQVYTTDNDKVFAQYQVYRAKLTPRELWPISVQNFATRWEEWKDATGCIDFTDMIEMTLRDTDSAPGNPSVGFFDEVQDFTPLELALVRKWAYFMDYAILAGDDDQTIYQFKGSTPDAFINPPVDDDHKRVLSVSYRVPRAVHALAQTWIERVTQREPKEYRPRDEDGEVRRMNNANFKDVVPAVMDAERYLADGKSVMFLTTCSYMLKPLQDALKEAGIPFHNPYRRARGDWNPLNGGKNGQSTGDKVLSYLRPDPAVWGTHARVWNGEDLKKWTDLIKVTGVLKKGAKAIIDKTSPVHVYSLGELYELFETEAIFESMDMSLDWLDSHLLASKRPAGKYAIKIAKAYGGHKLREEPQVVIGTIHSTKGSERDVVYLFPDLSRAGMVEWQQGGTSRDAIIRQFYVGMTRARESLIICNPGSPMSIQLK